MTHLLDTNICSAHMRRPGGRVGVRKVGARHRGETDAATEHWSFRAGLMRCRIGVIRG
jgi:hypothetical protein